MAKSRLSARELSLIFCQTYGAVANQLNLISCNFHNLHLYTDNVHFSSLWLWFIYLYTDQKKRKEKRKEYMDNLDYHANINVQSKRLKMKTVSQIICRPFQQNAWWICDGHFIQQTLNLMLLFCLIIKVNIASVCPSSISDCLTSSWHGRDEMP